jgi:hypothetical protein
MANIYDLQQLEEHREHLEYNVKRQTDFVDWLKSKAETDDTDTLHRAEIALTMFQNELEEFNQRNN